MNYEGTGGPLSGPTKHVVGVCSRKACDTAFVVFTVDPEKALPMEAAVALFERATCPSCGGRSVTLGLNVRHAEGVARMRRLAALD